MGALSGIFSAIGQRGDAASATGSANAKLQQLLVELGAASGTPTGILRAGVTGVTIARPDFGAGAANCIDGGAWTYSAWVEIVAAGVLAAHNLALVTMDGLNNANQDEHMQIGVGGAGAEVAIWQAHWTQGTGNIHHVFPIFPHKQIAANGRVSVRGGSQSGGENFKTACMFDPRPEA